MMVMACLRKSSLHSRLLLNESIYEEFVVHDILPSQTQLDKEIFDEPAGTRYTCYTQPFSLSSYTLKVLLAPLSIYVKDAAL